MQVTKCLTVSGGSSRLGASRRPCGDGSSCRHPQSSTTNPYGVLAFDEFTDEAKSLRCLSYLTNWGSLPTEVWQNLGERHCDERPFAGAGMRESKFGLVQNEVAKGDQI